MERYELNEISSTNVMLMKSNINGQIKYMISMMNIMLIKERLLMLTYYINYNGIESVHEAKKKNDYILSLFITYNMQ